MKLMFNQFKTLNLKGCVDRADDLLVAIHELHLSNTDAMALCKAQMLTAQEDGDTWESLAWYMAHGELFERQVRVEDPQCEQPPANWNAGFSDHDEPATPVTQYTVRINEEQRVYLRQMLNEFERNDIGAKLLTDLVNLPEDSKHMNVVTFIDE